MLTPASYWSVNYVRVYQLLDPENNVTGMTYIASEQPANTATNAYTAPNAVATPNIDVDSLCPEYNFTVITDGKYQYVMPYFWTSKIRLTVFQV